MKRIIEELEETAMEFSVAKYYFSSYDTLSIYFYPVCSDHVNQNVFDYFHNGILISRERAFNLVPGFVEDM